MLSLYILHLTLLSFVEKDFITHLEKLIAYWELFSETTFGFESRKLSFILKTLISNLLLVAHTITIQTQIPSSPFRL